MARSKKAKPSEPTAFLFRGDQDYRSGPVGLPLDTDAAQNADIQNAADHVLRKRPGFSSKYTSFTRRMAAARGFGGNSIWIMKISIEETYRLELKGTLRLLSPDDVYDLLTQSGPKHAKLAGATREAMIRNAEVLVEGQIPARLLRRVKASRTDR